MENLRKCPCCQSERMVMPVPKKGKTKVWCYYCGVAIDLEIISTSKWYLTWKTGRVYEDDPRWEKFGWRPVVRDDVED